jgi:mono/diheme cytochrome c family protein
MTPKMPTRNRFLVPTIISLVVVPLALTLLTIGARSPYTQGNLNPHYDASYTRTDQTFVGSPVPLVANGLAVPASADQVTYGQQLFTAKYCSGCHGLDGRGSIIGPSIVSATAAKLKSKTHSGPGAMPAFEPNSLSDNELAAMAAYLASMSK